MKKALYICFSILLAATLATVSCKKQGDPEIKYLDGTLKLDAPKYILFGESVHFVPRGVTHPKNEPIGYAFSLSPYSNNGEKNDTVLHLDPLPGESAAFDFLFACRDSSYKRALSTVAKPTTHSIAVKAFATGYAQTTASTTITTVIPGFDGTGSLKNLGFDWEEADKFTDPRDGHVYPYSTIGTTDWFLINAAYSGSDVKVYTLENSPIMLEIVGGYYRREDAGKVCPEGWRLPSDADVQSMIETLSGKSDLEQYGNWDNTAEVLMCKASFNDIPLWEFWPKINIPDNPQFCALPVGFAENINVQQGTAAYKSYGTYAAFWVSDLTGDNAAYRYLQYNNNNTLSIATTSATKGLGINVRCIR